ncbi:MAG: CapA family protein [Anaerolineales bacterium]|nr:CapA family protein [Anaerolineales bacterium]
MNRTWAGWIILILALSSCTNSPPTLIPTANLPATTEPTLVQPPTAQVIFPTWTPTALPAPPATAASSPPIPLALDKGAPQVLRDVLQRLIDADPESFFWTELHSANSGEAVIAGFNPSIALGTWVYAAVAPFPTIPDEINLADFRAGGEPGTLLLAPETASVLESAWGDLPAGVQLIEASELMATAWSMRPANWTLSVWSIVPFDALEPGWKVLRLDGLSPLNKMLDTSTYPLAFPIGLRGSDGQLEEVRSALEELSIIPPALTNRDENKMTVLAMTGVTALVRATAHRMETDGITYPGEEVAGVLQSADIAHISNEVSFSSFCPFPDPSRQDGELVFCSDDRYIELLEYVGADVIELTGNHVNDWGSTLPMSHTLAMYRQRNWGVFGGGENSQVAATPLIITHNDNTIGFIGCNPVGPNKAWATADAPGAASCTIQSFSEAISALSPQVDVVVAGIQYYEFYTYTATAQQRLDFASIARAGADIVNGSQGHHAQGFSLPDGHFVHYGLGNLFFDQMDELGTRQTFIDLHVIYDGRYISTELWTGLIENYARPRAMTEQERTDLLRTVFSASTW